MLIRWRDGAAHAAEDPFTLVGDDQPIPQGDVIVSLARLQSEGGWLESQGRALGVRLAAAEPPEVLAGALGRLAVVALEFPKHRDGRAFSAARVLRDRLGFAGELRAVGDVLLDHAFLMIRCGFDAFEPADGSTPEAWTRAAGRFRHVYQRASDERTPAFAERGRG
jgi:uncharacterized protein (DUF934 family)